MTYILVSEKERRRLANLSAKELKEMGFKQPYSFKRALQDDIFPILSTHFPKEAYKILKKMGIQTTYLSVKKMRSALISNKIINKAKKESGLSKSFFHRGRSTRIKYRCRLEDLVYCLILSCEKPLYPSEIAEVFRMSRRHISRIILKLYRKGKIEYRTLFYSGGYKIKAYKLIGDIASEIRRKIVYNPSDDRHLEYIARKIADSIITAWERLKHEKHSTPTGFKVALSYRLKDIPEDIRNLVYELIEGRLA